MERCWPIGSPITSSGWFKLNLNNLVLWLIICFSRNINFLYSVGFKAGSVFNWLLLLLLSSPIVIKIVVIEINPRAYDDYIQSINLNRCMHTSGRSLAFPEGKLGDHHNGSSSHHDTNFNLQREWAKQLGDTHAARLSLFSVNHEQSPSLAPTL